MTDMTTSGSATVLWQGFRHRWQYNHRVNRLGSYVEHTSRSGDTCTANVVHTAASGTGPDRARFAVTYTKIRARGVGFQSGVCEIPLETTEETLQPLDKLVEVELGPALVGKENYVVLLNGFDLVADREADKLMTLALETSAPEVDGSRARLSFHLRGGFRVDCSSPECDIFIGAVRDEYVRLWTRSVYLLDSALSQHERGPVGGSLPLEVRPLAASMRESAQLVKYTLWVHYLIVAGDPGDLNIALSPLVEHRYEWGLKNREEINADDLGKRHLIGPEVIMGDSSRSYAANTLAFKQVIVTLYRNPKSRRLRFWRSSKAMHLLELNVAIGHILETRLGRFSCTLDLFFKNWARRMKLAHFPLSSAAYRDAGSAQFGAQLALLQFRDAEMSEQQYHSGAIEWVGGGKPALDERAVAVHPLRVP